MNKIRKQRSNSYRFAITLLTLILSLRSFQVEAHQPTLGKSIMLTPLIRIAKHGELRDISFIEKTLKIKLSVSDNSLVYSQNNGIPHLHRVEFSYTPTFKDVDLRYSVFTQSAEISKTPYTQVTIASLTITAVQKNFCVTPSLLRSELNSKENRIYSGTLPPLTNIYAFITWSTLDTETTLDINEPDTSTGCSSILRIIQSKRAA